jgi:hypothetical protein
MIPIKRDLAKLLAKLFPYDPDQEESGKAISEAISEAIPYGRGPMGGVVGGNGFAKPLPYMKGLNGKDFVPAELKLTDLDNGTGI